MMNVNMRAAWMRGGPGRGSLLKVCSLSTQQSNFPLQTPQVTPSVFLAETPVEIIRPPQDMLEPPASDIVFEVELNKDRVEVKWMRNNMIIVQGDKYQMISEGKIHRLQVCEIRPRDQGEYRIVAKDKDARAKLELAGTSTAMSRLYGWLNLLDKMHVLPLQRFRRSKPPTRN